MGIISRVKQYLEFREFKKSLPNYFRWKKNKRLYCIICVYYSCSIEKVREFAKIHDHKELKCEFDFFSSRVCELGVMCCVTNHSGFEICPHCKDAHTTHHIFCNGRRDINRFQCKQCTRLYESYPPCKYEGVRDLISKHFPGAVVR